MVIGLLVLSMPIEAMYNILFRVVQVGTAGIVIGAGAKKAYTDNEKYNHSIDFLPASSKVIDFVQKDLVKLNVPDDSEVPVVLTYIGLPWCAINDRAIGVDEKIAAAIEADDMAAMLQGEALKKHEIKHILNKDAQKSIYAWVIAPCIVQAGSSTVSYGFNAIFKRQSPKKILSCIGRSLMATGAIIPKGLLSLWGVIAHNRHLEVEADRFACKHAESKQELEAFKIFFDKVEKDYEQVLMEDSYYANADEKARNWIMELVQFESDIEHPRAAHRSAMIQQYIESWDEEHKC